MAKVIVTGGSGFIGTNVIEDLLGRGNMVLNFDIREPRNSLHDLLWRRVDLLDVKALEHELRDFEPEFIVHMGARTDLRGRAIDDYAQNVIGVSNLLRACGRTNSLKRVVFASSMLVCKMGYMPRDDNDYCPGTVYGQSKVLGEQLIRREAGDRFAWLIVRPTSIWGPWFDVPYRNFFDAVKRGLYMHPAGVRVRRSYGYVGNAAYQVWKLLMCEESEVRGKTFYLADYTPLELRAWAETIRGAFGARAIREIPVTLLKSAAGVGDVFSKLGFSMPMTSSRLSNMMTEAVFDVAPLQQVCGALPFCTSVGVRATVDWMRRAA